MISSFVIRYHHDIVSRPAKVEISVQQQHKKLYQKTVDLRFFQSPLRIEFEFESLDPIQLIFETDCTDMDLFPFYIDRIEFDELIDVPFIAHTGKLISLNGAEDTTNCLYCAGALTYTFALPLCSNARVIL